MQTVAIASSIRQDSLGIRSQTSEIHEDGSVTRWANVVVGGKLESTQTLWPRVRMRAVAPFAKITLWWWPFLPLATQGFNPLMITKRHQGHAIDPITVVISLGNHSTVLLNMAATFKWYHSYDLISKIFLLDTYSTKIKNIPLQYLESCTATLA